MLRHPIFQLLTLHSDEELQQLFGAAVTERSEIHAWPLSVVQKIVLDNGDRFAYKAQLPPTVEAEFYDEAKSSLLVEHRNLGLRDGTSTMALGWIEAPLLTEVATDAEDLAGHASELVRRIGRIDGTLPLFLDVGDAEAWASVTNHVLTGWEKGIGAGWFTLTDPADIGWVRAWAHSAPIRARIVAEPRTIHGDLKADQVFVVGDDYRVIDWQRPMRAPADVDVASLLIGQGVDPLDFVDPAVVAIFWFLRLHWAVMAQLELFPGNRFPLFDEWAHEAVAEMRRAAGRG
jgi:hypothetical protein